MANQFSNPPQGSSHLDGGSLHMQELISTLEQSSWRSLLSNLRDTFFPEKLPPLKLTSQPVRVRDIWGDYNHRKSATVGSLIVHGLMLAALIFISIVGARAVKQQIQTPVVELVAPDLSAYVPVSNKKNDTIGGGGGGGDRDKLQAPKGKLPKLAMEQFTPPAVVIRNENPKLPMEPTVVIPPNVKVPTVNMPTLGDPMAKIVGPPSNGTGSGGGIGSGSGGGVGSGEGPGVGPGRGGGIGGGVFRIGGGVSAPKPVFTPDPEYSEEARKAKYQGICVLGLVVGPDGRPRDVHVAHALGMGLDEKAIQAVKLWKFEPAMKDGHAVAVAMNVEVSFRLY